MAGTLSIDFLLAHDSAVICHLLWRRRPNDDDSAHHPPWLLRDAGAWDSFPQHNADGDGYRVEGIG